MTIGEKIVAVRSGLKLSQESFARELGVTRHVISRWERGEVVPDYVRLKEVCDVAGITLDEFLCNDELDGETVAACNEEERVKAEQAERERELNAKRIANVKCTGLILFKISVVFGALSAIAALLMFFLRGALCSAFGFDGADDNLAAELLPMIFLTLSALGAAGTSPVLYLGIKNGKNKPIIAAYAIIFINLFAVAAGILLAANITSAYSVTLAALKGLSFVSVLFAATVVIYDCGCMLYFLDSIEQAPYVPLPVRGEEKYVGFAYAAGAVIGFIGTPVLWAAGFMIHSGIRGRTPVFADKFARSLVIGAIAEVVAIGLFSILRYILGSF